MWLTIVSAALGVLNLFNLIGMFASGPIGAVVGIIGWLATCFQAFLFVKFLKNDNLETREGVVKALMVGFLMVIFQALVTPLCNLTEFFAVIPGAIVGMIMGLILNFYCWKNAVNFAMRLKPSEYNEELHGKKVFGFC